MGRKQRGKRDGLVDDAEQMLVGENSKGRVSELVSTIAREHGGKGRDGDKGAMIAHRGRSLLAVSALRTPQKALTRPADSACRYGGQKLAGDCESLQSRWRCRIPYSSDENRSVSPRVSDFYEPRQTHSIPHAP